VEEGLIGEIEDPLESVKTQQVLVGKDFCANSKIIGIKESSGPRITDRRETGQLLEPSRSLSECVSTFQSDLETLKKRGLRNNLPRRCAITLCWDHAVLSHDEIAALFRMPSSN